jgi:hypothetical protein
MRRRVAFPFPHDRFPDELGAVVQRTVLNGESPARLVVHFDDNSWAAGDGVNDPNEPAALIATHIAHVIERNSSVAELATLQLGYEARRTGPGSPWVVRRHDPAPELP